MKNQKTFGAYLTLLITFLLAFGCSGDTARLKVQGPQLAAMTPAILADAEIGVRAQLNPTTAAALGVLPISNGLAESKRAQHAEFGQGMASFGRTPSPTPAP